MWNVAGDGDVENLVDNFDVKSGGERLMWNVVDNFGVECSRERLREIWWGLVMWNVAGNGDVGIWWGTVV